MLSYFDLMRHLKLYRSHIIGAQLQGVWCYPNEIVFSLYRSELLYLVFQYTKSNAQVVLIPEQSLEKKEKETLPLAQFANAHLKNKRLMGIELHAEGERVFASVFESGSQLDFFLIPGHCNLSVTSHQRTVWLHKPKPIKTCADISKISPKMSVEASCSFVSEVSRYKEFFSAKCLNNKRLDPIAEFKKKQSRMVLLIENDLREKKNRIQRLQSEIERFLLDPDCYDIKRLKDLKFNIPDGSPWYQVKEILFRAIKKWKLKLEASELRLHQVSAQNPIEGTKLKNAQDAQVKHMRKKQIKGRIFVVEGFIVSYGRSGSDNLNLIRSAQPWDLWFHFRDGPGSHFILRRNRGQTVKESVIFEVCRQVLKIAQLSGGSVVVTEVRFVSPIKGSAVGLVKYTHERIVKV